MSLTIKRCERVIRGALGGSPSIFTAIDLVNQASEVFCSAYEWSFLKGGLVDVEFVLDRDYADLPADFGHEVATKRKDGYTSGFSWTTKAHLAELRSHAPHTHLSFWGAVVWEQPAATANLLHNNVAPSSGKSVIVNGSKYTWRIDLSATANEVLIGGTGTTATDNLIKAINQSGVAGTHYSASTLLHTTVSARRTDTSTVLFEAKIGGEATNDYTLSEDVEEDGWDVTPFSGGGGPPTARIELYPTPTSREVDALKLFYCRTLGTATSDSYEVPLAPYCHALYIEILRALVLGHEEHDVASSSARLQQVLYGPLFIAASRRDARMQSNYGVLSGGVATMPYSYSSRYDNTIPDPA